MAGVQKKTMGFFGTKTRAMDSLARAEGMLEMMKLSRADFAAPQKLLEEARTLLAVKDYRKSLAAAELAEKLAEVIEERYRAARKAMVVLKSEVKELEDLGLDASEAKASLETAKERIRQGTIEQGWRIPNYLEARITAEEASKKARSRIVKAKQASDAIFTSQLAMDALREMEGPMDQKVMDEAIITPLNEIMQKSTELIAVGDMDEAISLAAHVEEKANSIRGDYGECIRSLESCENIINGLKGQGVEMGRAAQVLEGGRNLLMQAKVADAREAISRAEKEALMVSNQYRKAVAAIETADRTLTDLAKLGMSDPEAEKRLKDSKKALQEAKYLRASDLADDCRRSASRKMEIHESLGKSLRELRHSAENLSKEGVQFATEVEELLTRAESEYENRDYVNCGKDMKIASALLGTSSFAGKIPLDLLREFET